LAGASPRRDVSTLRDRDRPIEAHQGGARRCEAHNQDAAIPAAIPGAHFGEHFTLDGYGGDPARRDDAPLVRATLTDLCERIGMHPLAPPQLVAASDNQLNDPGGWSGVLLIAESHISIHTFPRRGFLTSDVYSCKRDMDLAAIEAMLTDRFGLKEAETHFLRRGLRYPAWNVA
jgi:S-adenosylmethionine decarboxylase